MLRRSPFDIRRFRLAVDCDLLTPLPCPKQNPGKQTDNHTHTHCTHTQSHSHICSHVHIHTVIHNHSHTCLYLHSQVFRGAHTHIHSQTQAHLDEKCSEEFFSEGLAWKTSAWRVEGQGGLGQGRLSESSKDTKGPGNSFHCPKEVLAATILGIIPLARANEFRDWIPDAQLS